MTQTDKEKLRMAKNLVKSNNKKIKKALKKIDEFENSGTYVALGTFIGVISALLLYDVINHIQNPPMTELPFTWFFSNRLPSKI